MNVEALFSINQFGLDYERLRLEAALSNIAQSNAVIGKGQTPMLAQVTATNGDFQALVAGGSPGAAPAAHLGQVAAKSRAVHDPANPMADANGDVHYVDVDMATEMTNLMSASRAYEANVRGINTLQEMTEKALQIGGR